MASVTVADDPQLVERISGNFERFNPYAARAIETGDPDESLAFATVAVAFEISQCRYLLRKLVGANEHERTRT